MSENNEFYTTGEVSRILGIAQRTVKNYCDSGRLHCEQTPLTNYRRIPKEALLSFMKENSLSLDLLNNKKSKKILIVDDDETFGDFMHQLVSTTFPDAIIEIATDGYEACMKAVQFVPDLVILDLKLPKEDGVTVYRKIKQNDTTKHAEILVVTGYLDESSQSALLGLNAGHVFKKPLDKPEFVKAMQDIISS